MKLLHIFCFDEKGGGLVEYVLILTLIAIVAVTAMTTLGSKLNTTIATIPNSI